MDICDRSSCHWDLGSPALSVAPFREALFENLVDQLRVGILVERTLDNSFGSSDSEIGKLPPHLFDCGVTFASDFGAGPFEHRLHLRAGPRVFLLPELAGCRAGLGDERLALIPCIPPVPVQPARPMKRPPAVPDLQLPGFPECGWSGSPTCASSVCTKPDKAARTGPES